MHLWCTRYSSRGAPPIRKYTYTCSFPAISPIISSPYLPHGGQVLPGHAVHHFPMPAIPGRAVSPVGTVYLVSSVQLSHWICCRRRKKQLTSVSFLVDCSALDTLGRLLGRLRFQTLADIAEAAVIHGALKGVALPPEAKRVSAQSILVVFFFFFKKKGVRTYT